MREDAQIIYHIFDFYIVVDVKRVNTGRDTLMLLVNSIKTIFAHYEEIENSDEFVTYDEQITLEQQALLRGLNFHEYPTIQELSATKLSLNFDTSKLLSANLSE